MQRNTEHHRLVFAHQFGERGSIPGKRQAEIIGGCCGCY
jgi:hypothetical protein